MGGNLTSPLTLTDIENEQHHFDLALHISTTCAEFKFCDKFLSLQSSFVCDYQTEFRRRVRLSENYGDRGGPINWDFWTGRPSSESAFHKIMADIDHLVLNNSARELCHLAGHVVECRKFDLNPRLQPAAYNAHLFVYLKWKEIEKKLVTKQLLAPTTCAALMAADSRSNATLKRLGSGLVTTVGAVGSLATYGHHDDGQLVVAPNSKS